MNKLVHIGAILATCSALSAAPANAWTWSSAARSIANYFSEGTTTPAVTTTLVYAGPMPRPATIGGIRYDSQPSVVKDMLAKARAGNHVKPGSWKIGFKQGPDGTISEWQFKGPDGILIKKAGTRTDYNSGTGGTTAVTNSGYDVQGGPGGSGYYDGDGSWRNCGGVSGC